MYRHLVRDSGMSQSSLQRLFKFYLQSPPKNIVESKGHVHLLIDGTYFENGLCLPSGSNLTQADLERVVSVIVKLLNL